MKKALSLLLCAVFALFLLPGCQKASKAPAGQPDDSQQNQPLPGKELFTAETMPRIDGSTATIPLSEGLVKYLLDYTPEQAQDFVHHNTTHSAYVNLINGDCDIIFVTPPSSEELALMEESGKEFEIVRVVKDAFVFLVNGENPVDNLSLEDIQAIYRGETVNWQQVGGSDTPITAYQRPDNSGSQTLMYKLVLPKDELASPPTEMEIADMAGLIEAVASYDGSEGAIGYSVFYYANDMYESENSKLLAVNGVSPTAETIENDTYPLTDGYYAVLPKDAAEDSPARQLLSFLLTSQGQDIAESEGYVRLSR